MAVKATTVGQLLARRLREARASRLWTQDDLASAMDAIGSPMHRTTIAKIEKGKRPVAVDELVGLAAALDVSPTFLMLSLNGTERVQITPKLADRAESIGKWMLGVHPLDDAHRPTYRAHVPEWAMLLRQIDHEYGRFIALEQFMSERGMLPESPLAKKGSSDAS